MGKKSMEARKVTMVPSNTLVLEGTMVTFLASIKDMGKKSMEARKVTMVPSNTSVVFMVGRVMSWIKNGCLIQITSGQGLHHLNNRLFAPFVEVQGVETG